ncbi:MAG: GAP family protein, partial [Acidiferrobacterales bacterium]
LFAFLVYAAGSNRPLMNSSAVLLGHTVAYFCVGIVLALGLERIAERLANPKPFDYVIGLIIGLVLILVAIRSRKKPGKRPQERAPQLTPMQAFGFGAVVNFIGIPFALPYFAAIDQILKADVSAVTALIILAAYNLLYALPFAIVPVVVAVLGDRAQPILERINTVLDRVSGYLMPLLLALVGLALTGDAIKYFVTGAGLF